MNKFILIPFLLVVSLLVNAKSPYDTKEKVINRAKAIVAYHVVAKKNGKFTKDPLKEKPRDVDALKKLIENNSDSKYDKICEEIKKLDDDASDKTSLIELFQKHLKDNGVKGDDALEQIKIVINGSDYPFENGEEENDVDDDSETNEEGSSSIVSSSSPKGSESLGTLIKKSEESIIEKDSRHIRSEGFPTILPLAVLIIGLLGSLFLCLQLWRKNKVLEEEKKKIIKELYPIAPAYASKSIQELAHAVSKKYSDMAHDLEAMKRNQNDLKEKIEIIKEKNGFSYNSLFDGGNRYNDAKSHEIKYEDANPPTLSWDIEKENAERLRHESEVIPEVVSVVGKEMFLYLPNDNMFKEGSEEYRSGKTLYKMKYTSDETADFEFVNRPETLAFAKQSRSRFLESACVIENDDVISFNTIQTIEKGKLSKVDEGWNIISKARIRLS